MKILLGSGDLPSFLCPTNTPSAPLLSYQKEMNILFTDPTDAKSEIKDSGFQNYYPAINRSMKWNVIRPFIVQATELYIIPLLGNDYYNTLVSDTNEKAVTAKEKSKLALAYYTIHLAIPHINITISESGVVQNVTEKVTPASLGSLNMARWNALFQADKFIDRFFDYLIKENHFSSWKESINYNEKTTLLFSSPQDLKKLHQIESFRLYLELLPYLRKAEDRFLSNNCSGQLKATLAESNKNDQQKTYIELCQKQVSAMALYLAIPELNLYKDSSGMVLISSSDHTDARVGVYSKNNVEAITLLRHQLEEEAKYYQGETNKYLSKNSDHFPIWKAANESVTAVPLVIHSDDCTGGVII